MTKAKTVEDYISKSPEAAQAILNELRALILATVPDVVERIAWNVPNYTLHGVLTGFAVYSQHVSLGFSEGGLSTEEKQRFESKGYKTGKGTVQIKFNQAVPTNEIVSTLISHALLNKEKTTKS